KKVLHRFPSKSTSRVPLRLSRQLAILNSPPSALRKQTCTKRQRPMDSEKLRISREKLTRVFRYLEALNQHRNPAKRRIHEQPWSLGLRDLPEHSSIQRGEAKVSSSKAKSGTQTSEANGATYVLKVQRPKLTRGPEPPEGIADWLQDGWDDPARAVGYAETLE